MLPLSLELMRLQPNYFVYILQEERDMQNEFIFVIRAGINAILGPISTSPSLAVGSDWGKLYLKIAFCINRCSTHIMGLSSWLNPGSVMFPCNAGTISSACFAGHTGKQEYQSHLSLEEYIHANVKAIGRWCNITCTCPEFSSNNAFPNASVYFITFLVYAF